MSVTDVPSKKTTTDPAAIEERLTALEKRLEQVEEALPEDKVALVVFSGELDRVLAAFVIATGAAAMGQEVSMFFTFWGLSVLKNESSLKGKNLFEAMMSVMSPGSTRELPVSKMNYFGAGAKMLRKMMADKNVSSLEEMIEMSQEMGVKMLACEMSREVMGIQDDELINGFESAGAASFLAESLRSRTNLFI